MYNVTYKSLTEVINNEYKDYAMYVLENRALPGLDGLKPVHKKLLYSMINYYKGKKIKNSELGASIASVANYHHGNVSAEQAIITLAASWNNNVPIFEQHGNFGSRLINEPAASRYIFSSLNPDFYKYFSDFNVCTPNKDPDNPEPEQYLPIIPWVLVNSCQGIAVGFSCNFLPHNPKQLAEACILALKNELPDDYVLLPTFPYFKGDVIQDPENNAKYITTGIVKKSTRKNHWIITECPWGFDREKIFTHLEKMSELNKIVDFEDGCNKDGFRFTIKLDQKQNDQCENDPIQYFKLEKSFTENYTQLDENGKLIIYNSKIELIRYFVNFRLNKVSEGIQFDIHKLKTDLNWYKIKLQFIQDVLSKKIDLMSYKKSILLDFVISEYSIEKEIGNKLISSPVYDMTSDVVEELTNKIEKTTKDISILEKTNPKKKYLKMLNELLSF